MHVKKDSFILYNYYLVFRYGRVWLRGKYFKRKQYRHIFKTKQESSPEEIRC